MTDDVPQKRLPFNEEVVKLSEGFTQQIVDTIPEIEAIAVVISYSVPNDDLHYAVVRGQNNELRTPVEIVHMCQQLWKTLNFQLQNGYRCIRTVDEYMKQQATELQKIRDNINAAKSELAALQQGREAGKQKPTE